MIRKEDFEQIAQEEKERWGISFEEFWKQHKGCHRCKGNTALGVFCFYAYLGEYDWGRGWKGQDW